VRDYNKPVMSLSFLDEYISLVRNNRDFRHLWFSQMVSLMGDWFNLIASAALVAKLSGAGLAIGGLFLARLLPPFILGPMVGVVADRFDRKKILILSDLLRTVVVLGFLLVRSEQDIWLLYTLTVLQLSISAFFEPTRAAVLPSLVEYKDLITANALSGITWSTMLAFGAALGGLATATLGITAAFLLDAATFLVSAWFLTQVHIPVETGTSGAVGDSGWHTFVDGLRYLWHRPPILIIALLKASSSAAFGGIEIVQVTFAESWFRIGDDASATLGLIFLVVGLGTGLGPVLARRVTGDTPQPMYWAILAAYIMMMAGYGLLGVAGTLGIVLSATFIRTFGTGINWVYASSLLQMVVPRHYLGRVFAFDLAMMTLASSASTLWAGWATDELGWGPHQISLALGTVSLITAMLWVLFMLFYYQTPLQAGESR
jgi:Na+/melibiose symporter-like transporter